MKQRLESPESFDVDGMLGKLAKWLRVLGFDAEFPRNAPSQGRHFVTGTRRARHPGAIVVDSSDCVEQLLSVLKQVGLPPEPELFLSRCLLCNVPVCDVSRESVRGVVPSAVFARGSGFRRCPKCGRVYWDGSHGERIKERLREGGVALD